MKQPGILTFLTLDGMKRAIIPLTALVLSAVFAWFMAAFSVWWVIGLVFTVPLVLLGIFDALQTHWTLTRNYPVAARIRRLAHTLHPYLRAYIVESDLEGKPYSLEARHLVYARAEGLTDTHPFGTERDVYAKDYKWLTHSIAPAATRDDDPRITVGGPQCTRPYSASVFNISAMSFGALSARAIEALNKGAKIGNFYHDTGEGGLSPYHAKHGGDLVWELGSGYFGCRDDKGNFDATLFKETASLPQVKMIEIKLSQGAKPGHGGLLPGAKVTEEIAATRKVPAWQDCLSPAGHSAFSTPVEMLQFVQQLRDLSGGKPVGIKFCVGQMHEVFAIMKAMLKTEIYVDFIVVDGAEGGTGAAPLELSNHVGMPLVEGLLFVQNALVGTGLRDKIKLAASGKVYSAIQLAENFAIGADWCNAARAFMFSIGCIQAQRCHLGTCPSGVATQDKGRQRGLVVDDKAENAARFHKKTLEALADITQALGLAHPGEIRPHHLYSRKSPSEDGPFDSVYRYIAPGALLEDPDNTPLADHWHAANPDSFKPHYDITEKKQAASRTRVQIT